MSKFFNIPIKIMSKTSAGRKDQLLESIKKKRKRKWEKTNKNIKKLNVRDIQGKTFKMDDESKIMDVDTYTWVSSSPNKEIKKQLKLRGFKE